MERTAAGLMITGLLLLLTTVTLGKREQQQQTINNYRINVCILATCGETE